MTWQSSLPAVLNTATCSDFVTEMKWWRELAVLIASTAMRMLPSVPFLNPTGHDSPEASCRCDCDSVVRAPMAPQAIASAMYCGEMRSRNSVPHGTPSSQISSRRPVVEDVPLVAAAARAMVFGARQDQL